MASILNLGDTKIFGDGFRGIQGKEGERKNRGDVVDAGEEPIEVNSVAVPWQLDQRELLAGFAWIQHVFDGRDNHQGHDALGGSDEGDEQHPEQQPETVRLHIAKKPPELR